MDYLAKNKRFVKKYFKTELPDIKVIESEATYLLWLDLRYLGLDNKALEDLLFKQAKLWLNQGYVYGEEGSGFVRLNIACSKNLLKKALNQLKSIIK